MQTIVKDSIKLHNGNKIKLDTGNDKGIINLNIKRPQMSASDFSQLVDSLNEAKQMLAEQGIDMTVIPSNDTVEGGTN